MVVLWWGLSIVGGWKNFGKMLVARAAPDFIFRPLTCRGCLRRGPPDGSLSSRHAALALERDMIVEEIETQVIPHEQIRRMSKSMLLFINQ